MNLRSLISVTDKKLRPLWLSPVTRRVNGRHLKGKVKSMKNLILMFGLQLVLLATPVQGADESTYHFNIPRQRADAALTALGQQADTTVIYQYDWVKDQTTNRLQGEYSLSTAVAILLANTALNAQLDSAGHLIITNSNFGNNQTGKGKRKMRIQTTKRKTLLATLVGVFAAGGAAGVHSQETAGATFQGIDEVIVTANKREQGLQDTAMSISVLSSETIEKRGMVEMRDYLSKAPGVVYVEMSGADKRVVFRGLSLGDGEESSAGVYLGEIPLTTAALGHKVPGISLVDIERIEILKGPQGTLYGAGALTGTVRNIPVAPDLHTLEGSVKIDVSSQAESDDYNRSMVGVLNVPLIDDKLALRVAAYNYYSAGFYDSVSTPEVEMVAAETGSTLLLEDDINDNESQGFRATLLWQLSDKLSSTLTLGRQDRNVGLFSVGIRGLGDYEAYHMEVGGGNEEVFEFGNLLVDYDLGWANVTSSASLLKIDASDRLSNLIGSPESAFGPSLFALDGNRRQFSQEIRLTSQLDSPWKYIAGLYYEKASLEQSIGNIWLGSNSALIPIFDPTVGATRILSDLIWENDNDQIAYFGELSYVFNDEWELMLGGRHSDYDRRDQIEYNPNTPFKAGNTDDKISQAVQTYKANLSFTPNTDTHLYVQWAEGFRLGKGQPVPSAIACDVDGNGILDGTSARLTSDVEADTTTNIEVGLKRSMLDNQLTLNAAVFQVEWEGLPVRFLGTQSLCNIVNNAGTARSQGIEFEINYAITSDLLMNIGGAYIEAEVTKDETNPQLVGTNLSNAPLVSASIGGEYSFALGTYPAFVRADVNYVGEYYTTHGEGGLPAGDYVNVDFRAGLNVDQWSLALYVKNLSNNNDAVKYILPDSSLQGLRVPRKIGLEFNYNF